MFRVSLVRERVKEREREVWSANFFRESIRRFACLYKSPSLCTVALTLRHCQIYVSLFFFFFFFISTSCNHPNEAEWINSGFSAHFNGMQHNKFRDRLATIAQMAHQSDRKKTMERRVSEAQWTRCVGADAKHFTSICFPKTWRREEKNLSIGQWPYAFWLSCRGSFSQKMHEPHAHSGKRPRERLHHRHLTTRDIQLKRALVLVAATNHKIMNLISYFTGVEEFSCVLLARWVAEN